MTDSNLSRATPDWDPGQQPSLHGAGSAAPRRTRLREDAVEVAQRRRLEASHPVGVLEPRLGELGEGQPSALARSLELDALRVVVLAARDHLGHEHVGAPLVERHFAA